MAYSRWITDEEIVVIGDSSEELKRVEALKKLLGVRGVDGDRVGIKLIDTTMGRQLVTTQGHANKEEICYFFMGFVGDEKDSPLFEKYSNYEPTRHRCSREMYDKKKEAHASRFYEMGRRLRNSVVDKNPKEIGNPFGKLMSL